MVSFKTWVSCTGTALHKREYSSPNGNCQYCAGLYERVQSLDSRPTDKIFSYDIDVEVETRHTIQITGVELVQSSVDIFEETNN